jgi:hypothetical protein
MIMQIQMLQRLVLDLMKMSGSFIAKLSHQRQHLARKQNMAVNFCQTLRLQIPNTK